MAESAGAVLAWWMPPPLPLRKGRRPHLIITLAETTLNGQDEQPGDLSGYGPLDAPAARQVAEQAATRSRVRLPSRQPGSQPRSRTCDETCERERYRPAQALIEEILAAYPTCTGPGCTRPAHHCDLDHVKPFAEGGTTCRHNLRPECRRHHRLKTHAGWNTRPAQPGEGHPPGTIVWTTRLGRQYPVPPPERPGTPDW